MKYSHISVYIALIFTLAFLAGCVTPGAMQQSPGGTLQSRGTSAIVPTNSGTGTEVGGPTTAVGKTNTNIGGGVMIVRGNSYFILPERSRSIQEDLWRINRYYENEEDEWKYYERVILATRVLPTTQPVWLEHAPPPPLPPILYATSQPANRKED